MYPNPATNVINLSIAQANDDESSVSYSITIISANGITVRNEVSSQASWQSNISDLLPGTYIIQVVNNYDDSIVGKGTFIKL